MTHLINRLIQIGIDNKLIEQEDIIYVFNRILAKMKQDASDVTQQTCELNLYQTLDAICDIAVEKNIIEDTTQYRDIFSSDIMNEFLDKPSVVNNKFYKLYEQSPEVATNWFYNQSKNCNYIKVERIAKNKEYTTQSIYGDLKVTINLSKPEKDPKEIELLKNAPSTTYPACLLCVENEGYEGNIKQPDRANHRMIRMTLNNRQWCMQYSPYLYYNEHCIVLSTSHIPMQINQDTFNNLLDFTTLLPHYFIGSNADLPIVGGSILSHEHYQGGNYTFPMNKATKLFDISLNSTVKAWAINWPLSTIRLSGTDKQEISKISTEIHEKWKNYSDESVNIIAKTGDTPHNTVTPICRRNGENYEMDIVLRNNRTSNENPLGIFHPHADVHHIKKENIGLIEVMGLAILPGRLLNELEEVKKYILNQPNTIEDYHKDWAEALKIGYISQDIDKYVISALGDKFSKVLEYAGVYKLDTSGIQAFKRFTSYL
ncbi:MAG: galactose-1-phosphate uridylyltransferase [Epulopiscium sp. Nuni2H_MBin003]|nr:MAG: galactose-1-phosphate uridylyltransferase [Epulopiscium sp. Nuni2H_MBin003]